MKKEDLLPFCKYYAEGKPRPEGDIGYLYEIELRWIDLSLNQKDLLADVIGEYSLAGLSKFSYDDDVPASLKALLFNRFGKWCSGTMAEIAEEFKKWYKKWY